MPRGEHADSVSEARPPELLSTEGSSVLDVAVQDINTTRVQTRIKLRMTQRGAAGGTGRSTPVATS